MLDASGMRALKANVVTTSESSAHFTFTQAMLQKHATGDTLESAFAAVIEPCAGDSFLASTKMLPVQANDADAKKAVAVEVMTKNGHADICFADGYPEKVRAFQSGADSFRAAGEFACYSSDAQGLRLATVAGGTTLDGPALKLKLGRREHTGKVVKVDYLAKALWLDAPWPAACAGKVFEIGSPENMTSYTSASVSAENGGSKIVVTRGADAYRSPLTEVLPAEKTLRGSLHVDPASTKAKNLVASNDTMTKFWRVDHVIGGEFKVTGGAFSTADFAPSGALRLWEYGVGDTVRQSTMCAVRRIAERTYDVSGDADAVVSFKAAAVEISADGKAWQPARAAAEGGWQNVAITAAELSKGPVYLRTK